MASEVIRTCFFLTYFLIGDPKTQKKSLVFVQTLNRGKIQKDRFPKNHISSPSAIQHNTSQAKNQ